MRKNSLVYAGDCTKGYMKDGKRGGKRKRDISERTLKAKERHENRIRKARCSKSPMTQRTKSPKFVTNGRKTLNKNYYLNRSQNSIVRPNSSNTVDTTLQHNSENSNRSFLLPSAVKSLSKFSFDHLVGIREELSQPKIEENSKNDLFKSGKCSRGAGYEEITEEEYKKYSLSDENDLPTQTINQDSNLDFDELFPSQELEEKDIFPQTGRFEIDIQDDSEENSS